MSSTELSSSITLTFHKADDYGRKGEVSVDTHSMIYWYDDVDRKCGVVMMGTGLVLRTVEGRDEISRLRTYARNAAHAWGLEAEKRFRS